jgi:multidrug efflux pump subunit AcrA (membrane-fusion protein)
MADITMPKRGFDMTEGLIVRWLKKVGDHVNKGEAIAEIETDKVTIEIETFDLPDRSSLRRQVAESRRGRGLLSRFSLTAGDRKRRVLARRCGSI